MDFKDLHLYVMQFNGPDRGAQVVSGAPYCAHCLTSVFRFAKGERVLFKGRSGRVAEGYASGKILQYEIELPDGERFMASEHEVQPQ